ncbi:MAG: DUF2589 domain-containing protein [Dysgonamonadaceae bacterium]|jgi:hypothetical protein|nr:DUF2589 domain-containing protein [Dysgonamonadaceae bacterium]
MNTPAKKQQRSNTQVMDLKQLIAAPLLATLEADAMTTQSYVDFLRTVAFETDEKDDLGKLRTFSFQYHQTDSSGKTLKSVEIPVISLIPIPLLQIKEATFDFDVKILDSVTEQTEQEFSFSGDNGKPEEGKTAMRAALAPQSGKASDTKDNSLTANMKVRVVMQQADMPAGLANLLSLSAHNVSVEDAEEVTDAGQNPRPAIN